MLRAVLLAQLLCSVASLRVQLPKAETVHGRREALSALSAGALMFPLAASAGPGLKPCPGGVKNCYSSAGGGAAKLGTWSWPSATSRTSAITELRAILEAYPQAGQGGVDGGGWTLKDDQLADAGYAKLEFKSAGTGNLAKFFNGGKPFTDDFEVSVEDASICIRSSSRVGDSDFGVNAKRVNYIAAGLRAKGWDAPEIKP